MEIIPTSKNELKGFYSSIHKWLAYKFGKANHCENKNCPKKSVGFHWALIRGKKYEFKRKNFKQLCYSCHKRYDVTDRFRENARKSSYLLKRTECPKGHPFTPPNLWVYTYRGHTYRKCRTCCRANDRAFKQKVRENKLKCIADIKSKLNK
jgi:hypothetical protein